MFHKHNWKEITRTYAEPAKSVNNITTNNTNLVARIDFGFTTILWECEDCQALRKEELLGKEVKTNG